MIAYSRLCRLKAILDHSYTCSTSCLGLEALYSILGYIADQEGLLRTEPLIEVQCHGISHNTEAW